MKQFTYTITDPLGIHARPAGLIAKLAKAYAGTDIAIAKDGSRVKASQILMLMGMGVKQGDEITVTAEGPDEDAALSEMQAFFRKNL